MRDDYTLRPIQPSVTETIIAGSGISISDNGDGTITISSGEGSMAYATRIDQAPDSTGLTYYKGEAAVGSATSDAVWRIQRITLSDISDDVIIQWADGDSNFNNVWDNRASLTYS